MIIAQTQNMSFNFVKCRYNNVGYNFSARKNVLPSKGKIVN